jgi:GT2 family glycosyltransferase
MNAGLDAVRDADAVLLLNADCLLDPGALEAMRAHLDDDARCGAVAPKLVRDADPGRIDAAGMLLDRRRKNNVVGHGRPASEYATPAEVFGPDGACALWRRAALDACAPDGEVFDEDLALWASDADLAWRARLLGWRSRYEPRATGRTCGSSGRRRARASRRAPAPAVRNRLLMIAKNDRLADVLRDLPAVAATRARRSATRWSSSASCSARTATRCACCPPPPAPPADPGGRRARPPYGLVPPRSP